MPSRAVGLGAEKTGEGKEKLNECQLLPPQDRAGWGAVAWEPTGLREMPSAVSHRGEGSSQQVGSWGFANLGSF